MEVGAGGRQSWPQQGGSFLPLLGAQPATPLSGPHSVSLARTILKEVLRRYPGALEKPMILDVTFQDLKQIALAGRVEKDGTTLVVGRPLIPDLKSDATGTRGEVRFTVDESDLRPRGPRLVVKPVALSPERKPAAVK